MRRLVLVPLATALLASGCSNYSTDVVARVDDAELTRDELADLTEALRPGLEGDADTLREMINLWIIAEAIQLALVEDNIEVREADVESATETLEQSGVLAELDDDLAQEFIEWQAAFQVSQVMGQAYGQEAVTRIDAWVKPRYGQLNQSAVLPLALDPALEL